jgi:hypothetical protein
MWRGGILYLKENHFYKIKMGLGPDPLSYFFKHILEEKGLSDLDPIKLMPTWRNKRIGERQGEKRIDRFLLSDKLMDKSLHFRQWIGEGGDSNHFPIFLEVAGGSKKPASPFKFNPGLAQRGEFHLLG